VDLRWADELDGSVEVVHPHAGAIAAEREHRLEVLPGHPAEHDTRVLLHIYGRR
jgi:hypothetical protein